MTRTRCFAYCLFLTALLLAPCGVRAQDAPAPSSSTNLYPPPSQSAGNDTSGSARSVPAEAAERAVQPMARPTTSDVARAQAPVKSPAGVPDKAVGVLAPLPHPEAPEFLFQVDTSLDELITPDLRAALPVDALRELLPEDTSPYDVETEPYDEEAVREVAARVAAAKEARRIAELERKAEEERRRKEAEAKRLAEEKRREEEARKKAEAERKRKEEEARRLAEQKRKEEEAKRIAEQKRKEEEAQRKAEEERKRKDAAAQRLADLQRRAEQDKQTAQQALAENETAPAPAPAPTPSPEPEPAPAPEKPAEPAPEQEEQKQVALAPEPKPVTKKPSTSYARPGGRLETDPAVLADPKAAKALEQFKHFALEWLAKNNRSYVKGTRDNVKVTEQGGTYVAQFMASEPSSLETLVKPSEYEHTPFIGVMRYEEKLYRAEGSTPEEAKSGTFEEVDSTRITEIFRYAKNKWQY